MNDGDKSPVTNVTVSKEERKEKGKNIVDTRYSLQKDGKVLVKLWGGRKYVWIILSNGFYVGRICLSSGWELAKRFNDKTLKIGIIPKGQFDEGKENRIVSVSGENNLIKKRKAFLESKKKE